MGNDAALIGSGIVKRFGKRLVLDGAELVLRPQDSYVDTYTCPGMNLDTELQGYVTIHLLSDTRVQVHERLIYTVTGNGKTFTDNESFTNFTDLTSGVQKFAGTVVNIQVPGYDIVERRRRVPSGLKCSNDGGRER